MLPIINKLSSLFAFYKIDMLRNLSLSSNASQTRYATAYRKFDINGDYSAPTSKPSFCLTPERWVEMVDGYNFQDKKAKREYKNNVKLKDFEYFKKLLENSVCHLCNERFTNENKPTLDRENNELNHTKENVKPCCLYCNCVKSNRDEKTTKLFIQLRKFAIKNNLPFSLCVGQEGFYRLIRDGITGGLSNVHHRYNFRGGSLSM
jgi:hypothetical protein